MNLKSPSGLNSRASVRLGYTTIERQSVRPALRCKRNVGGLHEDGGSKTVLPGQKLSAKISMRLVPGQNWKENKCTVSQKHIKNITPKGLLVSKVTEHHGGEPYVAPTDTM